MTDHAQEADIASINLTIEQAQASVSLGQALERLEQNADFQRLIMQDYMREQPIRLGHLLSDPSMQDKASQKKIVTELKAIGDFTTHLRMIFRRAQMAAEAIRVNEDELASIYEDDASVATASAS